MNLNHLAVFHAVAANSSISGAARELRISQSAVSRQLGEFERTLGLVLFDRLPRGVRATEAGRLLAGYARRLFAIQAEAEQALGDLQQLARGRIAIGASRTIGGYLLPGILARFRQRHPDVELSLQVENTAAIESKLVAGEIDIGFAEGVVSSGLLDYRIFAQDELVLIAAPRHAAVKRAPLPLSALAEYPLLMHEIGSGTRAVTERALADRRLAIRPTMTLGSSEAIKQTVAAGVGLAFMSSAAIRTELQAGILLALPVRGLHIRRPLYSVQLKTASRSPSLDAFLRLLEEPPS